MSSPFLCKSTLCFTERHLYANELFVLCTVILQITQDSETWTWSWTKRILICSHYEEEINSSLLNSNPISNLNHCQILTVASFQNSDLWSAFVFRDIRNSLECFSNECSQATNETTRVLHILLHILFLQDIWSKVKKAGCKVMKLLWRMDVRRYAGVLW